MASRLYPSGKHALLTGAIDLENDDIRAVLLRSAYAYSAAHDNLDDISAGNRAATTGDLANKTVTNGVFDADDDSFGNVTGADCNAVLLYLHTGVEGSSILIGYIDGFTLTPDGNPVPLIFDASGIFELTDA